METKRYHHRCYWRPHSPQTVIIYIFWFFIVYDVLFPWRLCVQAADIRVWLLCVTSGGPVMISFDLFHLRMYSLLISNDEMHIFVFVIIFPFLIFWCPFQTPVCVMGAAAAASSSLAHWDALIRAGVQAPDCLSLKGFPCPGLCCKQLETRAT